MTSNKLTTQSAPVRGLTPAMAVAIYKRQYPGVPDAEIMKAAIICQTFNLFPYGNQIDIIPFKTKVKENGVEKWIDKYVTRVSLSGMREICKSTGNKYSYLNGDGPRVMTQAEEETIYGQVDNTVIRAIVKIKDKNGDIWPGYGIWPKSQPVYGADKGNTPHNMSFVRAERNAIDRMAPGVLPQEVDFVDDEFIQTPVTEIVSSGNRQLMEQNERDIRDLWDSEDAPKPLPDNVQSTQEAPAEPVSAKSQDIEKQVENKDLGVTDRLITPAEIKEIYALLGKNNMGIPELGKWMTEHAWPDISKNLKTMTLSQLNVLKEAFKKGN